MHVLPVRSNAQLVWNVRGAVEQGGEASGHDSTSRQQWAVRGEHRWGLTWAKGILTNALVVISHGMGCPWTCCALEASFSSSGMWGMRWKEVVKPLGTTVHRGNSGQNGEHRLLEHGAIKY